MEHCIKVYNTIDDFRKCPKGRSEENMINKGFNVWNKLSVKGLGYEVNWKEKMICAAKVKLFKDR